MADAAHRIDEIIATAQETADQIRREAERDAERYAARRRREVDSAASELRARIRRVVAGLRSELGAIERQALSQLDDAEAALESDEAAARRTRLAPVAEPEPARVFAYDGRNLAIIRAGQLAVMGKGRDEIMATLRNELKIENPAEIVDEILP